MLGAISSLDAAGIFLPSTGSLRLRVGQDATLSGGSYAIEFGDTTSISYISNAGLISGQSNGINLFSTNFGGLSLSNSGEVSALVGYAISADTPGTINIVNSGLISGSGGINVNGDGSLNLLNAGVISTTFSTVIDGSSSNDSIVNYGTILGTTRLRDGADSFNGINGLQDSIFGGTGDDVILGGASKEALYGDGDNDILFGNGGGDVFYGGFGNDAMRGGADADEFFGGSGTDWVYYQNSDAGVEVDLTSGFGFGGFAQGDTYDGVEQVFGSQFRDELNGDDGFNYLVGGSGNDVMRGYSGNDLIRGDGGADVMNGGFGADRLVYTASNGAVNVNLTTGSASGGHATGDIFFSFENISGSKYNDVLTGSTGTNQLFGFDGDDVIRGYLGNDGLTGGAGADTFVFDNNGGTDFITDFENDIDKLDLSVYNYASTAQVLADTTVVGADVFINIDANDIIRLVGFAPNVGDLSDDLIL